MSERIRDLQAELATVVDRRREIDLLHALAVELRPGDLGRAIALSEKACEMAATGELAAEPYWPGLANGHLNLGLCYAQMANDDLALTFLFKSLPLFEASGDARGQALALHEIASIHWRADNCFDALRYLNESLAILDELGDAAWTARVQGDVGRVYLQMEQPAEALPYLLQALDAVEPSAWQEGLVELVGAISAAYSASGDAERALAFGARRVERYRALGDRCGEAQALDALGDIQRARGESDLALANYQEALRLARENAFSFQEAELTLQVGEMHLGRGQLDTALAYLEQALRLAQEVGASESMIGAHRALAEAFRQRQVYDRALAHYEQYHVLSSEALVEKARSQQKGLDVARRVQEARREAEAYGALNEALQHEIIAREKFQEELQRANVRLREEIKAREALIADLDAFAHSVAHDLKTPLTVIAGYSDILRRQLLERSAVDATLAGLADLAEPSVQMCIKAGRIVDELLIIATVRREDVVLAPVDMAQIVSELEKRLAPMIAQSQARIAKPASWPAALGQATWIEEVWFNYISNAIKYGGCPPLVELGATPLDMGMVRFWVRDNGNGINVQAQERLFESFTRLDRVRAEGHGLGLSIVKRIVEKLGGEVAVESTGAPGMGSVFSFTLWTAGE